MTRILASLACLGMALFTFDWCDVQAQNGAWATVKGRITWGGDKIPEPMPIDAVKANADAKFCLKDGPVLDEKWVVNKKTKGLRYTFVWLANEDPKNKDPLPIHPNLKVIKDPKVVIDQPCCMFIPHAVGMREGQILVAKNSATIPHNFKWTGNPNNENAGSNVLIAPATDREIKGLVADRFPIKIECNIHPWMNGWVRVFNHPYYAVTDENGAFEIKNAPVGNYRLVVWHGSGGWLGGAKGRDGQVIAIQANGTDLGDLAYPPPAN